MASINFKERKQIPGTLIWNPPTFDSGSETLGGTVLGDSDDLYFYVIEYWEPFETDILGRAFDSQKVKEVAMIGGLQRDFDKDMSHLLRPESALINTKSGKPLWRGSNQAAGALAKDRSGTLVLRPREVERNQGVVLYNCFGVLAEGAKVLFEIREDWGFPFVFLALAVSEGETPWEMGFLRDFGNGP